MSWHRLPTYLAYRLETCDRTGTDTALGALQQYYGRPNTDETRTPQNSDITWIVHENRPVSSAIVSCSYLFVATFATTWGPVSWTYPAEIFPSRVRAMAVSLATATNWFWNTVLAFAVPPLLWNISYNMYYIFGAFNAAAFVHMALLAPETKGYTLEEMDEVFDSGRPAWKRYKRPDRLEQLAREIEAGNVKVSCAADGLNLRVGLRPCLTWGLFFNFPF